eukprot:3766711-Rhodomonas_salina.4
MSGPRSSNTPGLLPRRYLRWYSRIGSREGSFGASKPAPPPSRLLRSLATYTLHSLGIGRQPGISGSDGCSERRKRDVSTGLRVEVRRR